MLAAMTRLLTTDSDLAVALDALIAADPRLGAVRTTAGQPPLRRRAPGLEGLCAIVMGQQLSTASAAAIWRRFETAFAPFDAGRIRRCRATTLARLGLSAPKIRTVKAISTAVADGTIDLDGLADLAADEAHARLTGLHGVGPWTADIYLLFCLGHGDAWPAGDLALQEAIRIAFTLDARPTAKDMAALAEGWRPWRGVAAHLFWAYYHAVKKRDGAPAKPAEAARIIPGGGDGR